jgi:outer membrane murein-binding lipoprotein Lpp
MEKIRELIKDIGASNELAEQICEQLERWIQAKDGEYQKKEEALNESFKQRLERAKKVCVEEVDKEKRNIAQKVEVYLESKANSVERAMTKQRALEESKAVNNLKKVKAILEGIELNGGINRAEYDKAVTEMAKLKRSLATLSESRDQAIAKANRATKIATGVLKKNKILEDKLRKNGVIAEEKAPAKEKNLQEIAEEKKSATPQSTRRVIAENQVTKTEEVKEEKPGRGSVGDLSPEEIAGYVGDTP